jgi:hypothetical protein
MVYSFIFIFLIIMLLYWICIVTFTNFLQCKIVKFTPPLFSFIPNLPILRIVSIGLIFPFS